MWKISSHHIHFYLPLLNLIQNFSLFASQAAEERKDILATSLPDEAYPLIMRKNLDHADLVMSHGRKVIKTLAVMAFDLLMYHGDVKLQNAVLSFCDCTYLIDFGFSQYLLSPSATAPCPGYTVQYAAPEVMPRQGPTPTSPSLPGLVNSKSDVLSAGVLLIEVAEAVIQTLSVQTPGLSELALRMVAAKFEDRPSMAEAGEQLNNLLEPLQGADSLPEAEILHLLDRLEDDTDPWTKESKLWLALAKFVHLRLALQHLTAKDDFVDVLDAEAAIVTFRDVGWDLADLESFLFSAAVTTRQDMNAYAKLTGLQEKLCEANLRVQAM